MLGLGRPVLGAHQGNVAQRMASDLSVPLSNALERFSEPSEWEELRSLESYAMRMLILGDPETEYERSHNRYHWLKALLEASSLTG